MKIYNAQDLIDRIYELNERLYENVLDIITNSDIMATGEWDRDEKGNMIMLESEDEQ